MSAQRARTGIAGGKSTANSETTRTPEGGPYRRKDAVFTSDSTSEDFSSVFQNEMSGGNVGVRVADVITDQREPERRYLPGHPDADKDKLRNAQLMNPAEDMVDLMGASRGLSGQRLGDFGGKEHDLRNRWICSAKTMSLKLQEEPTPYANRFAVRLRLERRINRRIGQHLV